MHARSSHVLNLTVVWGLRAPDENEALILLCFVSKVKGKSGLPESRRSLARVAEQPTLTISNVLRMPLVNMFICIRCILAYRQFGAIRLYGRVLVRMIPQETEFFYYQIFPKLLATIGVRLLTGKREKGR